MQSGCLSSSYFKFQENKKVHYVSLITFKSINHLFISKLLNVVQIQEQKNKVSYDMWSDNICFWRNLLFNCSWIEKTHDNNFSESFCSEYLNVFLRQVHFISLSKSWSVVNTWIKMTRTATLNKNNQKWCNKYFI